MTSKDRCPKCNGWQVYAEHSLYTDKWRIHCQSCGLSTALYDSWKKARQEWEYEEQEEVDDWRDRLDELEREEYYESKYGKEQE